VRNEVLSPQKAEADYGVVIDTRAWMVDAGATRARRAAIAVARAWRTVPKVQRQDPLPQQRAAE
jgi:N-methylhydantoinase B